MIRTVLFITFYCLLTPVALVRRALGYDPMTLNKWKKGSASVFVERNHTYTSNGMDSPR